MSNITELTDTQLDIKIAKLHGWKLVEGRWWHNDFGDGPPPDYTLDLNAVHEFEKTLGRDPVLDARYWMTLYQILDGGLGEEPIDGPPNGHWCDLKKIGHATARQRCEALAQIKMKEDL